MKKISFIFLLILLPFFASAEVVKVGGLWYNLNTVDNTAEVVASQRALYSGVIIIPASFYYQNKSYSVTSIGESAFEGCTGLTSITISSSVKSLEKGAFYGCSGLTSVKIPNGVTKIGLGAFSACTNLTCVIIPSSVTDIESYAFDDCTSLNRIVSESKQPAPFNNTVFDTHDDSYDVYTMATLVIPNGANGTYQSTAGWNNFSHVSEASEQKTRTIHVAKAGTLPNFISDMEKNLIEELILSGDFNGTDIRFIRNMSGVDFEDLRWDEGRPYRTQGILKALDLSNAHIVSGGDYFYAYGNGDYFEYFGTKNNTISTCMFYGVKLTSIVLPQSITCIESWAFHYEPRGAGKTIEYGGPVSLTIPNSVTSIGNYAFSGCSNLTTIISEIKTPFEIGYIGDNSVTLIVPTGTKAAYQNTAGWSNFTKTVEVGEGGFVGCKFETDGISYTIGENSTASLSSTNKTISGAFAIPCQVELNGKKYDVTSIGNSAFSGCSGLTSITIPNSVTYIGEDAFASCINLNEVHISDLEAWLNINIKEESSDVHGGPRSSSPLYYAKRLILNGTEIRDLEIPNTITTIKNFAFDNWSRLNSVTIPNSVTSIGFFAFDGCSGLTSVTIPNSVISIGDYAFWNCSGLISVTIPNSVTSIGRAAFWNCSSLISVTIPNSVTSIDDGAFEGCSGLTSVTIPNSVTSIGRSAFNRCSGLTSILSLNNTPPTCNETYVFNGVDKENCVLWVPKGSVAAYMETNEWKDFTNVREIADGDVNLDEKVNRNDQNALVAHIMGEKPEGFYEGLADLNGDDDVNAADVVKLVDILNNGGLSTDSQFDFDNIGGNLVVAGLTCTLNNKRNETIQLTKCELYCKGNLLSYKNFSDCYVAAGGSKECSFNNLTKHAANTKGFTVCWHYTTNGESYVCRYPVID